MHRTGQIIGGRKPGSRHPMSDGTGPNKRCRIPHKSGHPRTLRDMIRRHLREEGKTIWGDMARAWNIKPQSASRRMFRGYVMSPAHVEAVIDLLQLDEFDAAELMLQGAREAGWRV